MSCCVQVSLPVEQLLTFQVGLRFVEFVGYVKKLNIRYDFSSHPLKWETANSV